MLRLRHIYISLGLLACILFTGCVGNQYQAAGLSNHADILLRIDAQQTKAGEDYYSIRSIRIYAYEHDDQANNPIPIGYAYFPDINRDGPYLCPIQLGDENSGLTFPCAVDFLVIINDNFISPAPDLQGTSTLADLDQKTFSTISGNAGAAYVPMCNERIPGGNVDKNNYSFTVNGTSGGTQIIPIDVKRCVSRLTLNLTKKGESTVTVTGVTLIKGPKHAPLTLKSDVINATSGYFATGEDGASANVKISDSDVELIEGDPDTAESLIAETYLLPNPYGSADADEYISDATSSYDNKDNTYRLLIDYTIKRDDITIQKSKTVYFPSVPANSHIKVTGTIKDAIQDLTLNVTVNSWTIHEIDVPVFE